MSADFGVWRTSAQQKAGGQEVQGNHSIEATPTRPCEVPSSLRHVSGYGRWAEKTAEPENLRDSGDMAAWPQVSILSSPVLSWKCHKNKGNGTEGREWGEKAHRDQENERGCISRWVG